MPQKTEDDDEMVSAIAMGMEMAFGAHESKLKPKVTTFRACALNAVDSLKEAGFEIVKRGTKSAPRP